ncbi:MAG: copper resistance protein CopZ [Candidatus Margulisiibacteriota bacterium]|nr:MAG: copper resistance protein CopZ [Candidatus Margulisiibacteriota bacterium]HCY38075.1 copper resistance protein CopZ [Candidatus Margulisiibacteriota bacterium]
MKKEIINVEGMSCQHCVSSIKNALGGLSGVSGVEIDLKSHTASVEYDEAIVSIARIRETIEDQGYDVV